MDKLTTLASAYAKYRIAVADNDCIGPYNNVSKMSDEEYNVVMADICAENECTEQMHLPMIEKVSENLWRLPSWASTELRCNTNVFQLTVRLAEGIDDTKGAHVDALKELLNTDAKNAALLVGNQNDYTLIKAIEQFCVSCGDAHTASLPGDMLIQHLLNAIPKSALPMYPKNPYQAAKKVLQTLYPDSFQELQVNATRFNGNTEAENIDAMSAQLPTFTSVAKDKVNAWKQVTVTPTVAKIKLACGKDLSDDEAKTILLELQKTLQGAEFVDPEKKYRVDASSRAYYQSTTRQQAPKQQAPQRQVRPQKKARQRKPLSLKKAVIISAIAAILLYLGVPGIWVAVGAVVILLMF